MESNTKTSLIPIAESMGVDVSAYLELLASDNMINRIDDHFRKEAKTAVPVYNLPYNFYFEWIDTIGDDAAILSLRDGDGMEIGKYVVRAVMAEPLLKDSTTSLVRRLVFVGKDMASLYSPVELDGINLSWLNILPHKEGTG